MDKLHKLDLDDIIPGVTAAYERLRSKEGRGLYTSRGRFFNHTIFGRDASMSAKFVADFDHQTAIDVIKTLIALQGTEHNQKTQEEPGRIHHEWRDFRLWHGTLFEHIPFWLLRRKWAIRHRRLLTYFSLDTTALFIRLVHKYAIHIDASILEREFKNSHGDLITVKASLEAAADWIIGQLDDNSLFGERRANKWSLPVQTFQDSLYTRRDGTLADVNGRITYVEVQAFAADALYDMSHLFPDHEKNVEWREIGLRMHRTMLAKFSLEDGYLASAIDSRGQIDVPNISAGWVLNSFIWHEMDDEERIRYITPVVERLFSDEFLTPIGLRSRSLHQADPIHGVLDYHGSETVWPMFSFMVVEGLRRHRLYDLAEQLENRIINGLNAVGNFSEYHTVQRDGTIIIPTDGWFLPRLNVQMKQEKNIGFSVVPAIVMARRAQEPVIRMNQKQWQQELEQRVLATIPRVERAAPEEALQAVGQTQLRHLRRWVAGAKVVVYFLSQRKHISRRAR